MTGIKDDGAWRENLLRIAPYVPGEQKETPTLIKLNTNENPYPPSPAVTEAIRAFHVDALRRYPVVDAGALRRTLADYCGVSAQEVFVGNGSDEVLALAFKTCFNSEKPVLFPDITYSFFPVWCRFFGIPFEEIPLSDSFRIEARAYAVPNGGVVIANPNAPTGLGEGKDFVESLLEANRDSVVIIDEAYGAFGAYSAVPLIRKYDNLLVSQTFSKSRSLAGLRLGFCFGSAELIAALDDAKNAFNSYTVSNLALEAGKAAVADDAYFREQLAKVVRTRDKTAQALRGMGFTVTESLANFLFVTRAETSARALYAYLKEHNILVRHFDRPRIENFLRITVGTDGDMDALLGKISEYTDKRGV
ncbi:MAG: aminotransferase class I/II-fold pyridoxal phosphate-dependent enzyme [Clostridiales Family XIII bacterium]|nr:aminotransferase class I/II-fold pyridoxal phosphate-dependent enzyme [Clostridiales Family XIII bacterium]